MNLKDIFKKEKKDSADLSVNKKEALSLFGLSPRFDWLCIILISIGILTFLLIKNYSVWSQVVVDVAGTDTESAPDDSKKIDEEKYSEIVTEFAKRQATYESIVGSNSTEDAKGNSVDSVATTSSSAELGIATTSTISTETNGSTPAE